MIGSKTRDGNVIRNALPTGEAECNPLVVSVVEQVTSGKKSVPETQPRLNLNPQQTRDEILLVEDSDIMKKFYERMLRSYFKISSTDEEESALRAASDRTPRLILIDDGGHTRKSIRLAKKLRSDNRTKGIPVLMMLPIDVFRRARTRVAPYVDMCIPKTFTASVLMPSLQSLLSS